MEVNELYLLETKIIQEIGFGLNISLVPVLKREYKLINNFEVFNHLIKKRDEYRNKPGYYISWGIEGPEFPEGVSLIDVVEEIHGIDARRTV